MDTMCHQYNLETLFPVNRFNAPVVDFVKQVDQMYRGLGIPTLYGTLSVLANKSVFFIGCSGTGKTRIVRSVPKIEGTHVQKCDAITMDELNQYCRDLSGGQGYVHNKHLVFNIEEFSTLSEYHKEQFLTVCSKLITDGEYKHITKHFHHLDLRACKLTMLVAIQPNLYSLLCGKPQWESMSYDRFSKFVVINPLRTNTNDDPIIPTLPQKINQKTVYTEGEVNLDRLITMYRGQISDGRAELYAKDYAIAMAKFMDAETVQQYHIDLFFDMFHQYLDSFSILQKRHDLDSPLRVSTGSLILLGEIGKRNNYVKKRELAEGLKVNERSIERPAQDLLEVGLIEKPTPHAGKYCLSKSLRNHFNWYENLLS